MTTDLRQRLTETIDMLDLDGAAADIARSLDISAEDAHERLSTYVNESWVALELVEPLLQPGARILEIGSGIGFFAGFLSGQGFDVVELEPVGAGFEFIGAARAALALALDDGPDHLDVGVEALDAELHGRFDLIYSLNVLEHVPDWQIALDSAGAVLAPGGTMCQSCPNYSFPYEPHFGIPLLPVRPSETARLLPERITDTDLWRSLNWVTLKGVRQWADGHDYSIEFEAGRLADALERLSTDEQFANRHSRLLGVVARTARRLGVFSVLRKMPPSWTSPMIFTVRHQPLNRAQTGAT
jgi:2-polyprenyl-3-methyl-5-hydroxy-6-metoxy-1,4-benzoquinol methylase